MEENTSSKVGTFVSSAVNKILNLVMILVIVALVGLVAWFWHNNQLLEQKIEGLEDEVERFEEMSLSSGDGGIVVKESEESKIMEDVTVESESKTNKLENNIEEFHSKLVDLSFSYPSTSGFKERDYTSKNSGYTGKRVNFYDSKGEELPEFFVLSSDFSEEGYHIVEGNLNSVNSFKVKHFVDKYTKIIQKGEGVYHVTGYYVTECSPSITSYLMVRPVNSNIKYIYFILESESERLNRNEIGEDCSVKENIIKERIDYIVSGKDVSVNQQIDAAMELIKTMK